MSARPKRNRRQRVSEHVQNVPTDQAIPPGAQMAPGAEETVTIEGGEETNVNGEGNETVTVEEGSVEIEVQDNTAASKKKGRRVGTTGARKLSDKERDQIGALILLLPNAESYSEMIPLDKVPEEIKTAFYGMSAERNLFQRGLVIPMFDDNSQLMGLQLTEIAIWLYNHPDETPPAGEKTVKAPGPGRTTSKYDGLRMRLMVEGNPRVVGTQGHYSYNLYKNDMSYREYLEIKDFAKHETTSGSLFRGPLRAHWDWDLSHGYFALYREGEPETLEDGSPNPKFWVIKNVVDAAS